MKTSTAQSLLEKYHVRHTVARKLVLDVLQKTKKPLSPYDVQKKIAARGNYVNTVTIYRTMDVLLKLGLVHRHPCSGQFILCKNPAKKGCHAFLHCQTCDSIEEFHDSRLCNLENTIAKESGFQPATHITEIIGTCAACA